MSISAQWSSLAINSKGEPLSQNLITNTITFRLVGLLEMSQRSREIEIWAINSSTQLEDILILLNVVDDTG